MLIKQNEVIAIIVDIQERLFPHIYKNDELEANCLKLLKGLQALEVDILVAQQYTKGIGETIPSIKALFESFEHMEKTTFSCATQSIETIKAKYSDKKYAILLGIETHICVLQSALELLEAGITPILVVDCTSTRKESDKEIALKRLHKAGVILTTYESILFELCRDAKNKAFKEISNIVK